LQKVMFVFKFKSDFAQIFIVVYESSE